MSIYVRARVRCMIIVVLGYTADTVNNSLPSDGIMAASKWWKSEVFNIQ